MTRTIRSSALVGALAAVGLIAAACGEPGQSGAQAPPSAVSGEGCAPVAGDQLVVLVDDRGLQTAENIVPAVHGQAATPDLLAALNAVSAVLDTPTLVELNKAVDIDRKTPPVAAEEFAAAVDFTSAITPGDGGEIVVGAANFSESQTLGHLYRIALEAAGFDVRVQAIGNRELYLPELQDGAIDVVPEYAGTLTEFLNAQVNGAAPPPLASNALEPTMTALRELGEEVGLVFGTPAEAANQNAFAVTSEFAETHGIRTLSDLAEKCSGRQTILGGPPECPQRPFCQPGLEEVYEFQAGEFSSLDAGGPLTKQALRRGDISVGLVFSTDGDLAS